MWRYKFKIYHKKWEVSGFDSRKNKQHENIIHMLNFFT